MCMLDDKWQNVHAAQPGGILGTKPEYVVAEFYHDRAGATTEKIYIPDTDALNAVIDTWAGHGIRFIGFVHAHPPRKIRLSSIDVHYANKIKKYCRLSEILMVIYIPTEKNFYSYVL